ncbi:hypothetical protein BGZ57DRAFT_883120 [Hyaloscypha finlandica]|nr:hypothetical protein BGZ57DRAFT_883120 [Hyaloscypha finlandica]
MFAPRTFPEMEHSYLAQTATFESPWQLADDNTAMLAHENHSQELMNFTSPGFVTRVTQQRVSSQPLTIESPNDMSLSTAGGGALCSPAYRESVAMNTIHQMDISPLAVIQTSKEPQKERFHCDYAGCGELTFKYESQLKKHVDRHNRPFSCDECDEAFGAKKDLKRHRDTKHEKETEVFCTMPGCKRAQIGFSRRDNLLKHIHNVHAQKGEEKNLSNSAFPKSGAKKMPKTAKKRKRMDADFEELSREELIESLLEEQSKNKRLLQEMEQQKGRLEEELRGQRERYEKNEDRLWRMIEEKQ